MHAPALRAESKEFLSIASHFSHEKYLEQFELLVKKYGLLENSSRYFSNIYAYSRFPVEHNRLALPGGQRGSLKVVQSSVESPRINQPQNEIQLAKVDAPKPELNNIADEQSDEHVASALNQENTVSHDHEQELTDEIVASVDEAVEKELINVQPATVSVPKRLSFKSPTIIPVLEDEVEETEVLDTAEEVAERELLAELVNELADEHPIEDMQDLGLELPVEEIPEMIEDEEEEVEAHVEELTQGQLYPMGHSSDRFIVKFKTEGPHALKKCAHCLLKTKKKFQDHFQDRSDAIDKLINHCKVSAATTLLYERHGLSTEKAKERLASRIKQVKQKFPNRGSLSTSEEIPDLLNTYVFHVPEGSDVQKICSLFEADPHVEYAHPDHRMSYHAFPTDPPDDTRYSELYGLNNMGQTGGTVDADIDAPEAWMVGLGSGMVVAVVDTGLKYDHVDISTNVWINTGEDINSNGVVDGTNTCPTPNGDFNCVDDDGNGFVDDIRGYDFGTCSQEWFDLSFCSPVSEGDNDPMDLDGHGSHVSGTIAAIGDNAEGIIGVAPSAKIMPVKGFPDSGFGNSSDLANAIIYAAMNGADVINNSWGCTSPCPSDPTAENAVKVAHNLGSVVVFSAGNETDDVSEYSPQNMRETIAVAATDDDDDQTSFTNFGSLVDVSAPGNLILSLGSSTVGSYFTQSGTSMAAPHVSGLAALIIAGYTDCNLKNIHIKTAIRQSADDVGLTNLGTGRINANTAMTAACSIFNECGNKVCDINETCSTCKQDCGSCRGGSRPIN